MKDLYFDFSLELDGIRSAATVIEHWPNKTITYVDSALVSDDERGEVYDIIYNKFKDIPLYVVTNQRPDEIYETDLVYILNNDVVEYVLKHGWIGQAYFDCLIDEHRQYVYNNGIGELLFLDKQDAITCFEFQE